MTSVWMYLLSDGSMITGIETPWAVNSDRIFEV